MLDAINRWCSLRRWRVVACFALALLSLVGSGFALYMAMGTAVLNTPNVTPDVRMMVMVLLYGSMALFVGSMILFAIGIRSVSR